MFTLLTGTAWHSRASSAQRSSVSKEQKSSTSRHSSSLDAAVAETNVNTADVKQEEALYIEVIDDEDVIVENVGLERESACYEELGPVTVTVTPQHGVTYAPLAETRSTHLNISEALTIEPSVQLTAV